MVMTLINAAIIQGVMFNQVTLMIIHTLAIGYIIVQYNAQCTHKCVR